MGEQYGRALEMDPNSGFAHWALGNVYVQKGMYEEAVAEYKQAIPLSGDSPDELASLGYAYALSGKRRKAQAVIDELNERSKRRYISPTIIAFIYAGLGENDQAFALLDKAYGGRDFILIFLKVDPTFDRLRSDPGLRTSCGASACRSNRRWRPSRLINYQRTKARHLRIKNVPGAGLPC